MVEKCDTKGKVRKMATMGGPHMGVDAMPHCIDGAACKVINGIARDLVYTSILQNHFSPAGYFRNPAAMSEYEQHSVFLPSLNNEINNATQSIEGVDL